MKKILAIDDKHDNLVSLKAILGNYLPDCEVLLSNNGKEGIELAKKEVPDTIILDLIMPGLDGYSVCKILKENDLTKHIPVILLTAIRTDTESKVKGLDSGADAFITKPIEPSELIAQINVMLRIKEAEDDLRAERERLDEMVQHRTSELNESKNRLNLFMDSATDIFTLWSDDFKLLEINKLNSNFIHSSECKEEILGKELKYIFPKLSQYHDIKNKLNNENTDSIEIDDQIINNNSEKLWFIHKVFKAGKGFGVITTNVTSTKMTELALRESEEMLRNIFENSTNLFFSHTSDGKMIYVSPQVEQMLGYTQDEAKTLWNSIKSDNPINKTNALKTIDAIITGKAQAPYEFELVHKSGKKVWVEVREVPMVENGTTISIIGSLTDITERKLAEYELRKTQEQLRQSQKMEAYGQLAGGIAHDFNNILGTILGYSELIEDIIAKDDKVYSKIQNIKSAAKRAADLTKQLLAFSRKQTLQPQISDLNMIIKDLKKMLYRMIEANIDLVTEFDSELHKIMADPGQMGQIIMNLVVNARDAMPKGGVLKIKTKNQIIDETSASLIEDMQPGNYTVIEISDTGSGMDKEVVEHIFEPFYTTKDVDRGTGLGLSVVHGIVKQSNGFISVNSVLNEGTTFSVYFPSVIESFDNAKVTTLHRENLELSGNEVILIVEDNQELRSLAKEILKAQNYNVVCAENSSEAIEFIEDPNNKIDLLLTDIIMPGISGIELASKVNEIKPEVKVVFISGYADGYLNKMDLPNNIAPLLEKPFTMKSLLEIVRDTLDCKNPI